ncbi:putative reverse transcriptase zinc-binding domain-containing protein [Helianthus debilis subsp. tardiflorus]
MGLMAKWWWRYKCDNNQLWGRVIDSIHAGGRGGNIVPVKKTSNGIWNNIVKVNKEFCKAGINLNEHIILADSGPSNVEWKWKSRGQGVDFSVKHVRSDLESSVQTNSQGHQFRWNKLAVPKVNLFVWRAINGNIATATALAARGVPVGDNRCRVCGLASETADHLLASCVFAKAVWWQVFVWLQLPIPAAFDSLNQMILHCLSLGIEKKREQVIHAICLMTAWCIWLNRNNKVFKGRNGSVNMVAEEVKVGTYWWVTRRTKRTDITLDCWNRFNDVYFG